MSKEYKPCANCGNAVLAVEVDLESETPFMAYCPNCGFAVQRKTMKKALRAWNKGHLAPMEVIDR